MGIQGRFCGPECTFVLPKEKNTVVVFFFISYLQYIMLLTLDAVHSKTWISTQLPNNLQQNNLHVVGSTKIAFLAQFAWRTLGCFLFLLNSCMNWESTWLYELHLFFLIYSSLLFSLFLVDLNIWKYDAMPCWWMEYLLNIQCGSLIILMICLHIISVPLASRLHVILENYICKYIYEVGLYEVLSLSYAQ